MAEHKLKALHVANELPIAKVKDVLKYKLLSEKREAIVFEISPKSYLFVYSFGALVFYDVDDVMMSVTIKNLKGLNVEILKDKLSDEYIVVEHMKNSVEFNEIKLKTADVEKLKIVSLVLAQSVALEYYENKVDLIVSGFSSLNRQLSEKGRLKVGNTELMKLVGANNMIIESIVSKLSLLDEPAVVWDNEEAEWIFYRLQYMFDMEDRFKHLQYKLDFIKSNSELILEAIRSRTSHILEWIVIALIAIEIVIFFYERAFV